MTPGRERRRDAHAEHAGDDLYDLNLPSDHFFRRLRDSVRWDKYTYRLLKLYRARGERLPLPMEPTMALRMLLLCEEYGLTVEQLGALCNEHVPTRYYVGLTFYEKAPSNTELHAIKRRIVENGKDRALGRLLRRIAEDARDKGATFERLLLVGQPAKQSLHTPVGADTRDVETDQPPAVDDQ